MKLNREQYKAKTTLGRPLLVLAGAGSGKTRVITEKIAHLIENCQYQPSRIVAVTFTNKAATEMKQRIQQRLGNKNTRGLLTCTFHTLGLRILKRDAHLLGYQKSFQILDQNDSLNCLSQVAEESTDLSKEQVPVISQRISSWKNLGLKPNQVLNYYHTNSHKIDDDAILALSINLYEQYQSFLQYHNAFDFDDLISQCIWLFNDHPDVLEHWQQKIRYLLVDEYQDTNDTQYELVRLLVKQRPEFTVVGDDCQSIYSWRGANPNNLMQLEKDFPTLQIIKLEQNYRSTQLILTAANKLIAHNPIIHEKNLWSELNHGDKIEIVACNNNEHEAHVVASFITNQRLLNQSKFDTFGVLYRSNHQSRQLEQMFRRFNIPYKLTGGQSFFERQEIKDVLAYLRFIINPEDTLSLLRIINTPKRGIGPTSIKQMLDFSKTLDKPLGTILDSFALQSQLSSQIKQKIEQFAKNINEARNQLDSYLSQKLLMSDFLSNLINIINLHDHLNDISTSENQLQQRLENIKNLGEWLNKLLNQEDVETMEDGLQKLALYAILEKQSDEEETESVTLMTLHSAKGLEFPTVILTGLEEGNLPHQNSIDLDQIEEERRLFYVGITRAQYKLLLTYSKLQQRFGETSKTHPSRFLSELPQELLIRNDKKLNNDSQDKQTIKTKGLETLSKLKNLLSSN